jgi:hypothetical protein
MRQAAHSARRHAPEMNFCGAALAFAKSDAAVEDDIVDDGQLIARLGVLRLEHRDLDDAIAALINGGPVDQLQLARLKKRKLRLRDEIAALEDLLIPDIIA